MTDTIETAVTPDPHAIARAVLLEVADEPDQVGDFVVANELEDHVTDFVSSRTFADTRDGSGR